MTIFIRLRPIVRGVLAVALLAVGAYLLVESWGTFVQFGFNRSPGYPRVSRTEITFWYAFPGFEAGLLLGLVPTFLGRSAARLLFTLNLAIWTEYSVNFGVFLWLIGTGAFIP